MYNLVKYLLFIYYKIFYKVEIVNKEKLENANGVIISGNHLSNHDPLLFPPFFNKRVRFIAKEELFKIPFIKQCLNSTKAIPVKRGTFDKACIKEAVSSLNNGEVVGIFPEGTRSKSKELELGDSHKGTAFIALRAKVNIIPFAIVPKKNFKLFSTIKIIFGEEIDTLKLKEEGYSYEDITNVLMQKIEKLIEGEK